MRKIPFAGIELTSQRVRGLRGTSELPGRPASLEAHFSPPVVVLVLLKRLFRVGNHYTYAECEIQMTGGCSEGLDAFRFFFTEKSERI